MRTDANDTARHGSDRAIVIVHSLAQARAAAEAAAEAGVGLLLRSAAGAAANAGVGWFLAVVRQAQAVVPAADIVASIDVADDVALALECLHAGAACVRFTGDRRARSILEDVSAQLGAALDDATGDVLDLRFHENALDACRCHVAALIGGLPRPTCQGSP